jgi:hypothetical protein
MSVDFNGTTQHYIPQDRTLYGQPVAHDFKYDLLSQKPNTRQYEHCSLKIKGPKEYNVNFPKTTVMIQIKFQ